MPPVNRTHILTKKEALQFMREEGRALCGRTLSNGKYYQEICFLTVREYLGEGTWSDVVSQMSESASYIKEIKDHNMCENCLKFKDSLALMALSELD